MSIPVLLKKFTVGKLLVEAEKEPVGELKKGLFTNSLLGATM